MTGAGISEFEYLRNDIYHVWLKHPHLTTLETITLLRKLNKLDRPIGGLKGYIDDIKVDFDGIDFVVGEFSDLPDDDTTPGSNPFMSMDSGGVSFH